MEPLILETISRHISDNGLIRSSRHGFTKGKSCLTNVKNICDKMTGLVNEGRAVDVVYCDFGKVFHSLP